MPQIRAITGHSLKDAGRIVDEYLPRDVAMAKAAIAKLETGTNLETGEKNEQSQGRASVV